MKLKRMAFQCLLVLGAVVLLSIVGCDVFGAPVIVSESATALAARWVLPIRQHWEGADYPDGMFFSYWEKHYELGFSEMDLVEGGYRCLVENETSDKSDSNTVCGKGIASCWGETINWKTTSNNNTTFHGVYGWQEEPLVEYYIGRKDGVLNAGKYAGTYTTSQGDFDLYVLPLNRANILNPEDKPELPKKFLQFNCLPKSGAYPQLGPINMGEHYIEWDKVMVDYWPTRNDLSSNGWSWYPLVKPNYCIVATEAYGKISATSSVENITIENNITVNPIAQSVSYLGTNVTEPLTISVRSSEPWSLLPISIPDWLSVSPSMGNIGDTIITVQVTQNTVSPPNERRANLEFYGVGTGLLTIAQIIQFYQGEHWTPAGGGDSQNLVITRTGDWTAQSSAPDWLKITPTRGSKGTYGIYMMAAVNNSGTTRSATITISGGGKTIVYEVTQAPVSLSVSPNGISMPATYGENTITINSNTNWWSAYTTDGGGWLSIKPGSYSGAKNGKVSFTVTKNTTGKDRIATITIIGGDVPTKIVTIVQSK